MTMGCLLYVALIWYCPGACEEPRAIPVSPDKNEMSVEMSAWRMGG